MKRRFVSILLSIMLVTSGCLGQNRLDELTLVLSIGVDVKKNGELEIYSAVPVFQREAKKKMELLHVHASSFREGRDRLNNEANGLTETGKVQNIVIAKRVLQEKGLFDLMDVLYRDPKSSLKADLIMVDDPIERVMNVDVKDKPRFPVYLRELIRAGHTSEACVYTTARNVYDQFYEKGITPYLTQVKLSENKLQIAGTALIDRRGYYVDSLNPEESIQLLILQQDTKHPIYMTAQFTEQTFQNKDEESRSISYSVDYTYYDYKTSAKNGRFQFDLHFKYLIVLTEVLVKVDPIKDKMAMERAIAAVMKQKMEGVVAKLQKKQVDPIGLGKYARAYAYEEWKKVEDDWGKAFSKAKISIHPEVKIISVGALKK